MSKVVHLSDQAHNKAKAYCQPRGLKMSEWVASLIDEATQEGSCEPGEALTPTSQPSIGLAEPVVAEVMRNQAASEPADLHAMVPKKKLASPPVVPTITESALPVYEAPPFWAR